MKNISVDLGARSYSITIASKLLGDFGAFWSLAAGDKAMVVTNNILAELYLSTLLQSLSRSGIRVDYLILPEGEEHKNLATTDKIFSALLEKGYGRDTTLIALGGGVIGDITGFAAATYQRGVRFIQVPTTLLAQVDSSVGGKTAVNHVLGKNMIGAFYQPVSVVIDTDCLHTLPARELASGMAEVIKYAVILDRQFFYWLEENLDTLMSLSNEEIMTQCILRCCALKASIVEQDEHEAGRRALLNLGHTYGHAIETHLEYGHWLHGEAVAAGMVMASYTAQRLGIFQPGEVNRLITLLKRVGLPIKGPESMTAEDYLPHMMRDKKAIDGELRLVLPLSIGQADIIRGVDPAIVLAAINDCQSVNS